MKIFESLKSIAITTVIVFVAPVIACLIFKFSGYIRVGPVVLYYSLFSLVLLSAIYVIYFKRKFNAFLSTALGIVFGVVNAVLVLNLFMYATHFTAIANYVPM